MRLLMECPRLRSLASLKFNRGRGAILLLHINKINFQKNKKTKARKNSKDKYINYYTSKQLQNFPHKIKNKILHNITTWLHKYPREILIRTPKITKVNN